MYACELTSTVPQLLFETIHGAVRGTVGLLWPNSLVLVLSGCHTYAQCCSAGDVMGLESGPLGRGICNPPHAARVVRFSVSQKARFWRAKSDRATPEQTEHSEKQMWVRECEYGNPIFLWGLFLFELLWTVSERKTSPLGFFDVRSLNSKAIFWRLLVER